MRPTSPEESPTATRRNRPFLTHTSMTDGSSSRLAPLGSALAALRAVGAGAMYGQQYCGQQYGGQQYDNSRGHDDSRQSLTTA